MPRLIRTTLNELIPSDSSTCESLTSTSIRSQGPTRPMYSKELCQFDFLGSLAAVDSRLAENGDHFVSIPSLP